MGDSLNPWSLVICISCGHSAELSGILRRPGVNVYAAARKFKCTQCGEKFARFDHGSYGSRFIDFGSYGPDEGASSDPGYALDGGNDTSGFADDVTNALGVQEGWGGYEDD